MFSPWTRSSPGFIPQRFLRHGTQNAHSLPGICPGRPLNYQGSHEGIYDPAKNHESLPFTHHTWGRE